MIGGDRVKGTKEIYIQQLFSSIADSYDLVNSLLSFNRDKEWRRFAISKTGVSPGDRVLDVATGTGELGLELIRMVGEGIKVIGVDFCREILSIAQAKLTKAGCNNLELVQAKAEVLPFSNEVFESVTTSFALRNVADLERTFREMARVVREDGKVVCLEFSQPSNRILRAIYYLYLFYVVPVIGGLISKSRNAYKYFPQSIIDFPPQERIKEIIEKSGFARVDIYPLTFGVASVYVGVKEKRQERV